MWWCDVLRKLKDVLRFFVVLPCFNVLCPSPPTYRKNRSFWSLPSGKAPVLYVSATAATEVPEVFGRGSAGASGCNQWKKHDPSHISIFQFTQYNIRIYIYYISSSSFVTRTSPTSVSCGAKTAKSATLLLDYLHCFGLFPGATSRLHEPPGCHTLSTWQLYKIDQNRSKGEDVGRVSAAATASYSLQGLGQRNRIWHL